MKKIITLILCFILILSFNFVKAEEEINIELAVDKQVEVIIDEIIPIEETKTAEENNSQELNSIEEDIQLLGIVEENDIEILEIEEVAFEAECSTEDGTEEYIIIEDEQTPLGIKPSIKFYSSHAGQDVVEGTKITLTAKVENAPENARVYWEYSDDNGKTAHYYADGYTCIIIADLTNEGRLYRAVLEIPE